MRAITKGGFHPLARSRTWTSFREDCLPFASEKMSLVTDIPGKVVFGNVASPACVSPRNLATSGAVEMRFSVQRHPRRLCHQCANRVRGLIYHGTRAGPRFNAASRFRPVHGTSEGAGKRHAHPPCATLRCRPAYRYANACLPGSESAQNYLGDAIRIIRAATDISGDVNSAFYWHRNGPASLRGFAQRWCRRVKREVHVASLQRSGHSQVKADLWPATENRERILLDVVHGKLPAPPLQMPVR